MKLYIDRNRNYSKSFRFIFGRMNNLINLDHSWDDIQTVI